MNDKNLSRFESSDMTPAPFRNGRANNGMNGSSHRGAGSSSASSESNAGIDVAEVLEMLRRGKWVIIATTIVVVALVAAYTYTVDPVYEARSIVKIDLGAQGGSGVVAFGQERDLASEVGVLQYSAELASRVVDELRATEEALEEKGKFPLLYDAEGNTRPKNEVMSHMMENVRFVPMQSQSMIQFTVESGVPEEASTVANLYMSQYEIFSREKARASVTAARDFLQTQAEKRREEIRQLEQQWEAFAQSNRVVTQGAGGERLVAEYTDLTARRDGLQFELKQEKEALRLLKDQLAQVEPGLRETVQQEQTASGLRSEINVLEQKIGEMRAEVAQYYVANDNLEGDSARIDREFPELAELLKRIDGLEKRKRTLTNQLVAEATQSTGLPGASREVGDTRMGSTALDRVRQLKTRITEQEITIGQLEAQIAGLNGAIQSYEPRLNRIPQQTIQREQLERKIEQAEQFYQSITTELQRTIVAEESELGYVEVVRRAFVPSFPVRPNIYQNLVLGLLLGLGFGVGLAFLRGASNARLHRPDDLLRHGYRVTGVVPNMRKEIEKEFRGKETVEIEGHTLSTRLLPILSPWSPITENYRLIRTNMQYAGSGKAYGEAPQTILVTSPEPGDGKTTTAINLALTFVLSGKKVLLIDADMRRPNAHNLLGMSRSPGLAEMLRGDDKVQVVRRTYVDGLYFVPAGNAEDPPTEALDSMRMDKLIELGKSRCDIVIIDTPPVLAASDPLVLAPRADATLVVTAADSTDVSALDLTRDMLEGVGVSISGVIFNRFSDADATNSRYNYGYYKQDQYKMVS